MQSTRRWLLTALLSLVTTICLVSTLSGCGQSADGTRQDSVVQTDTGPVRGTVAADHRLFQGIPFAAPPMGALRWQPPQPARPWTDVRDATRPGSRCPQPARGPFPASTDEDCLYLNVTTPLRAAERPRPVMVWIHGGTDVGAGSDYDGTRLAVQGDVALVTVNYRLTVFGNFAHPELPDSGSFGLADQQAALRWVQRNAQAFGGDPANVTVFGESRGSIDLCTQLTSPGSAGLFQRAILQSGPCNWSWPASGFVPGLPASPIIVPVQQQFVAGQQLAQAHGCATVDCLRALPADGLLTPQTTGLFSFGAFGNSVLPENPDAALHTGRFHQVPVMIGLTRDETRLFVNDYFPPITAEGYHTLLTTAFGANADIVSARYPLESYPSPDLAWAAVTTDRMFGCTVVPTAQALAARVPVYGFEFADPDAPTGLAVRQPPRIPLGAYHSSDLYSVLPYASAAGESTPVQQQLSDQVIGYWSNFAHTGNPNGSGLPEWAPLDAGAPAGQLAAQQLAPGPGGIRPVDLAGEHHCDLWSRIRA